MSRRFGDYEIDRIKDKENRRKHGLPLDFGNYLFGSLYFETVDRRRDYGETRLIAVGLIARLGDRPFSVTYTWREDRRRFISVRQASGPETREYHRRHA